MSKPEKTEKQKEEGLEARQYTVWSDLRAMKFLSQAQQDMRSLKAATNRLHILLALAVLALGISMVVLAVFLVSARRDIEQLREQLPAASPSATQSFLP
jgi:subtilase family serine protease